jgi:hypothetical protein
MTKHKTMRLPLFAAPLIVVALLAFANSALGAPMPGWQPIGVTGPTNVAPVQNESQRLTVSAESGTFTLTAGHAVASGVGDVNQGTSVSGVYGIAGSFAIGQTIEGGRIPAGVTITAVGPESLTLSKEMSSEQSQRGARLTATDGTTATTAPLPYNASAAEVETALDGLSLIGGAGGSVSVSGGPGTGNPYSITFEGSLGEIDVAQLSADASGLSGGAHSVLVKTTVQGGPGIATLALYAQNIGGIETDGSTVTLTDQLPAGITILRAPSGEGAWECPGAATGDSSFTCTTNEPVRPGLATLSLNVPILDTNTVAGSATNLIEVIGGGAPVPASYEEAIATSALPALPGFQAFTAGAYNDDGTKSTRAGSHPYGASTAIFVNTVVSPTGRVVPAGDPKTISVDLPPGFLGNPIATPQCPEGDELCEGLGLGVQGNNAIVGTAQPILQIFGQSGESSGVFNMEAPIGYPGKFHFNVFTEEIEVLGSLNSETDYGINTTSPNTPQLLAVYGVFFTFWGAPASPSHDTERCGKFGFQCEPSTVPQETAFLTMPTDCSLQAASQPLVTLNLDTWVSIGQFTTSQFAVPATTECDQLHFESNFTFEPSDTKADSPASFRTELAIPEEGLTNPEKLAVPEIKKTVVKLPKGVVLNASGADGLEACSEAQIGLKGTGFPAPNPIRFNKEPNQCPAGSKIGSGELKSALLAEPLHGALYLAAQGEGNPFGSLFAVYLVIEDPRHGVFVKIPGEVEADKQTGQLEVIFDNLPQVPFTYLRLTLKGGDRSALGSPTTCGNYVTTAINTPWSAPESGPPSESANGFEINQGPNGGPCAKTPGERPFDIGLKAGSSSTQAGASAPFTFQITRPDGSQELESLELQTPQGVSASLKGIPYCTETEIKQIEARTGHQELEHSACPAQSQIGITETAAGSGPTPFHTAGKLYLAPPYKGAPISVLSVTPAVAGPFDLGNVVVRSAVFIDRSTAQVFAKTDPIPQLLDGVALRIRDVRIHLDHSNWTINPTSCDAGETKLTAHGNSGASAQRSARFQVGGCDKLVFKPKFSAKVLGGTKRGDQPAFSASVTFPQGAYANTKDVAVTLPHSEFLDQAHINTVCTRVQAAAHECPAGSIYGFAEAESPVIDGKLTGPVFLKSSVHKLPDLAIALKGPDSQPVEVEFAGRIDSVKGQIRDTIEGLPDVPVSRFVLRMKGGKKGLLENSRDLCKGKQTKMTVVMSAHNNAEAESRPPLQNSCKKNHKRHHKYKR